jgi:hypothetical protein
LCQKNGSIKANLDIIKPSDWWAFSHPKWRKEEDFPGSIPGEIYTNALYYFAPQSGIAVDPMAGRGMLKRVYDDRDRWQKDSNFELKIKRLIYILVVALLKSMMRALLYQLKPTGSSLTHRTTGNLVIYLKIS